MFCRVERPFTIIRLKKTMSEKQYNFSFKFLRSSSAKKVDVFSDLIITVKLQLRSYPLTSSALAAKKN